MTNLNISKLLLLNASCLSLVGCGSTEQPKSEKLNVLMIAVDDLRPELNCYGQSQIVSPNIDALAESGTMFTRSYCNIAVSGASRASLISGTRPNRDRFLTFLSYAQEDNPSATPIGLWFKQNGYTTISNGKISHHQDDWEESWDDNWRAPGIKNGGFVSQENVARFKTEKKGPAFECADVPDNAYADGMTAEKTIADLERLAKSGEPFFLGCGFIRPHLPFNAPKKYWDLYNREDITLPDNYILKNNSVPKVAFTSQHDWSELRFQYLDIPAKGPVSDEMAKSLIHAYYASVSYTDAMIGKVMETLKRTGLDKNTVVLLFGDHGWHLGEHSLWCKHSEFNNALHTPLIVHSPNIKSSVVDQIVEYVDIYPTLCDLAGIEAPSHLDGESLSELMKGNSEGWKNFAVSKYQNGTTLVSGNYFYTEWRSRDKGKFLGRMLFDHSTDPEENNNLAEKPEYKELVDRLQKELEQKRGFDYE